MIRAAGLSTLLAATALFAGCSTGSTVDPCDPVEVGDPEACRNVLSIATEHLGWSHGPVASTRFAGSMCPPGARCRANLPGEGIAIFTFLIGDPVMIQVFPEPRPDGSGNIFTASDPEPVPDWYLAQLP
jgi:hypothetical protein